MAILIPGDFKFLLDGAVTLGVKAEAAKEPMPVKEFDQVGQPVPPGSKLNVFGPKDEIVPFGHVDDLIHEAPALQIHCQKRSIQYSGSGCRVGRIRGSPADNAIGSNLRY